MHRMSTDPLTHARTHYSFLYNESLLLCFIDLDRTLAASRREDLSRVKEIAIVRSSGLEMRRPRIGLRHVRLRGT